MTDASNKPDYITRSLLVLLSTLFVVLLALLSYETWLEVTR
jgi:hypothetical protein